MTGVAPALLGAWLAGRSRSRGLPPPVAERGGFRVETGAAAERRRWVFAAPAPGLRLLGATVRDPCEPLKLCAAPEVLLALLPAGWQAHPPAFFMAAGGPVADRPLPAGYELHRLPRPGAIEVRILGPDGALAASGHGAETGDAFVYDRIVTDAAHRRRGLGRAVMQALRAARRNPATRELLTATADGRALYETLGWRVLSPYSTASWGG